MRVVSVSSGGSGDTGAIINLAGALAELGSDVLILDERPGVHGVAGVLGLNARFDLDEMIVRGPAGIHVLPMARCASSLSQLSERELQRLLQRFGRLGIAVDTLLVDAPPGRASSLLAPGAGAQEVIVIAGGSAEAITSSYALIKRLSMEFACREFHVLVSNVASESRARAIVANLAGVAQRYLRVSLEFMGHVPPDEKLQYAARLRLPVVTAFPEAAAAGSFRGLAQVIFGWPCGDDEGCGLSDVIGRLVQPCSLLTAQSHANHRAQYV
jgi:flagellar biosynthesis protein FlhG